MARFAPITPPSAPPVPKTYQHGYAFPTSDYVHILKPGLTPDIVAEISTIKSEPKWMLKKRLEALQIFSAKKLPTWGADLTAIDFSDIRYYLRPVDQVATDWNQVPKDVKTTFDRLKIPEAERAVLAGVKAQYDSEVVYGSLQKTLHKKGVIFLSMDEALKLHPDLVRQYFGTIIPPDDNTFSALNSAVWSGGSFVYVPPGVQVDLPLQTYFRINSEKAGQFERTLIIVDEGASVHYVEGCFLAGTPVTTDGGIKSIETITTEDKLLSHLGVLRKIKNTQKRQYTGQIFTITSRGNPSQPIHCTSEHPFLVVRRQRSNERNSKWIPEWIPASQLMQGDYLCLPINQSVVKDMVGKRATFYHVDEKYLYAPVRSIVSRQVKNISVYNFSVDQDESYVVSGVAVHNCTAPKFSSASLHSAVVEIIVKPGARCQYTTVQNWYKNVYNLVTKRTRVEAEGTMIWTDCNLGAKVTMKYPSCVLAGEGARGETLSIALAGSGQHQDTGAKMIHLAPHTSSNVVSKSISVDGGRTSYRGLTYVSPSAHHSQNSVVCDALLLDSQSRSDTYPTEKVFNSQVALSHEATVSKIGDDQLFYLMSRGVDEETARKMIVRGFVADIVKALPIEYAVEMNRLIEFEMTGSIG